MIIVVAAFFLSFDLFCFCFACSVTTEVAEFTQVIYGTISYRIPASIIFFGRVDNLYLSSNDSTSWSLGLHFFAWAKLLNHLSHSLPHPSSLSLLMLMPPYSPLSFLLFLFLALLSSCPQALPIVSSQMRVKRSSDSLCAKIKPLEFVMDVLHKMK